MLKVCIACNLKKTIAEFEVRSDTSKVRNQCKECRNAYVNQYKSDIHNKLRNKKQNVLTSDGCKSCIKCDKLLPLDAFPKRNTQHGFRHECKQCKTKDLRKYYEDVYNEVRRTRKQNDSSYKLMCNHRLCIYKHLTKKQITKTKKSIKYTNCSLTILKSWLEFQFTDGMTWDNYGTLWTVDHVLPLNAFNLLDEKDQQIAFNWKNMRPCTDNFSKSNKIMFPLFFSSIVICHRFIQTHNLDINEYQGINESLCWLRDKLRNGKNLTDEEIVNIIISRNGQSAAKLLKPQ